MEAATHPLETEWGEIERKLSQSTYCFDFFFRGSLLLSIHCVGDLQMCTPKSNGVTLSDSLFVLCLYSMYRDASLLYLITMEKQISNCSLCCSRAWKAERSYGSSGGTTGFVQKLSLTWRCSQEFFGSNTPVFWSGIWLC